jgi:hypothetical protein
MKPNSRVAVQRGDHQPVWFDRFVPHHQRFGALCLGVVEAADGDGVVGEQVGVELHQSRIEVRPLPLGHLPQCRRELSRVGGKRDGVDVVLEQLDCLLSTYSPPADRLGPAHRYRADRIDHPGEHIGALSHLEEVLR